MSGKNAKGADGRRQTGKELARSSGGALDSAPVLRELLRRPANGWNITRKPVHPGEMLREEFLIPFGISANKLAIELRVPVTRISQIVNERRAITADTALRLERYFGMSASFWLNLQKDFELLSERQARGKQIAETIQPRPAA